MGTDSCAAAVAVKDAARAIRKSRYGAAARIKFVQTYMGGAGPIPPPILHLGMRPDAGENRL